MNLIEQINSVLRRLGYQLTDKDKLNIKSIPFDSIDELSGMRVITASLSNDSSEGILVLLENKNGMQYVIDVESARFGQNFDGLIIRSSDKVGSMYIFRMVFYPGVNQHPTYFNYPKDNDIVDIWQMGNVQDANAANKHYMMMIYGGALEDRTISKYASPKETIKIEFDLTQKDGHLFLTNITGIELENQEPIDIGQSDSLYQALDIMKTGNYIVDSLVPKELLHTRRKI